MATPTGDSNAIQQIIVYGYLRSTNLINENHAYQQDDVISLMVLYFYHYAQFYDLSTDLNKIEHENITLCFGDIFRNQLNHYKIIDINGKFIPIGRRRFNNFRPKRANDTNQSYYIMTLKIPYEICKHLLDFLVFTKKQ